MMHGFLHRFTDSGSRILAQIHGFWPRVTVECTKIRRVATPRIARTKMRKDKKLRHKISVWYLSQKIPHTGTRYQSNDMQYPPVVSHHPIRLGVKLRCGKRCISVNFSRNAMALAGCSRRTMGHRLVSPSFP